MFLICSVWLGIIGVKNQTKPNPQLIPKQNQKRNKLSRKMIFACGNKNTKEMIKYSSFEKRRTPVEKLLCRGCGGSKQIKVVSGEMLVYCTKCSSGYAMRLKQ